MSEWIKVSDRLPEKNITVMIYEPHCRESSGYGYTVFSGDPTRLLGRKSDGTLWITHWMPLPEPPE